MLKFERGQMTRIAKSAGTTVQYVSDLWAGRKRAAPELAAKLEEACRQEGLPLHKDIWMYPEQYPRERIEEEKS